MALTIAGRVEAFVGNYVRGRELLTRAQRLSPRDPRGWFALQGMAVACLGEGQFEEGASWACKALAQNPRFANSFRVLAAHLAYLGQLDAAREAAAESLRIDPDFTISKFRSRRRFLHETFWQTFSEGMRLAGLPE
jgi:tetratricopeptide (TPR) repeat protein